VSIALLLALPSLFLQILSGQADQVGFSASLLSGATGGSGQDARPPDLNLVALGLQYLLAIALMNIVILVNAYRTFQRVKAGELGGLIVHHQDVDLIGNDHVLSSALPKLRRSNRATSAL